MQIGLLGGSHSLSWNCWGKTLLDQGPRPSGSQAVGKSAWLGRRRYNQAQRIVMLSRGCALILAVVLAGLSFSPGLTTRQSSKETESKPACCCLPGHCTMTACPGNTATHQTGQPKSCVM